MEEIGGHVAGLQGHRFREAGVRVLVQALAVVAQPEDELGLARMGGVAGAKVILRRPPRLRVAAGLDEAERVAEPGVERGDLAGVGGRGRGRRGRSLLRCGAGQKAGEDEDHPRPAPGLDLIAPRAMAS